MTNKTFRPSVAYIWFRLFYLILGHERCLSILLRRRSGVWSTWRLSGLSFTIGDFSFTRFSIAYGPTSAQHNIVSLFALRRAGFLFARCWSLSVLCAKCLMGVLGVGLSHPYAWIVLVAVYCRHADCPRDWRRLCKWISCFWHIYSESFLWRERGNAVIVRILRGDKREHTLIRFVYAVWENRYIHHKMD